MSKKWNDITKKWDSQVCGILASFNHNKVKTNDQLPKTSLTMFAEFYKLAQWHVFKEINNKTTQT